MKASIVPVTIWPGSASRLYIRAGSFGPPPSFYWELQSVTPTPAVPAVAAVGMPGELGFVPEVPETPAGEITECLKNGNATLTDDQWNDYPAGADDSDYLTKCIADNLGLLLV